MTKTKRKTKIRKNKTKKNKPVEISSDFESGNIINKSSKCDKHLNHIINLEIREEPYPKKTKRKYKNWFYFKAMNLKGKTKFNISNIRNYFNDWKGYGG